MHTFIIIEPNTPGNDSNQWRVADAVNYTRYRNGAITGYAFIAHETRESAEEAISRTHDYTMGELHGM